MAPLHTILVVDDEADVVASIQDLLRLDFHVLGATRAHDGLRILNEQHVHVILSDQRMPGMSGVELLRRVREEHPEITRLLFTGYADLKAV
ncbi:MAG TPA: response regulator, partial [Gemmataceae bacterium]|nr:response regulator [Gemmataceae bacterium]